MSRGQSCCPSQPMAPTKKPKDAAAQGKLELTDAPALAEMVEWYERTILAHKPRDIQKTVRQVVRAAVAALPERPTSGDISDWLSERVRKGEIVASTANLHRRLNARRAATQAVARLRSGAQARHLRHHVRVGRGVDARGPAAPSAPVGEEPGGNAVPDDHGLVPAGKAPGREGLADGGVQLVE